MAYASLRKEDHAVTIVTWILICTCNKMILLLDLINGRFRHNKMRAPDLKIRVRRKKRQCTLDELVQQVRGSGIFVP